jgi:uncharacterized membrane protein
MNEKRNKTIYLVATCLLTLLMLFSSGMYFLKYEMMTESFVKLGYPTYLIYPLAIAKLLGLIAIWTNKSRLLKEWAYAGFFFDMVLASVAHLSIMDGDFGPAIAGLLFLITAVVFERKLEQGN